MAIKQVEMAVRDPANASRFTTEMREITVVRVNVRCVAGNSGGRYMTDVALEAPVKFRPGEVRAVIISEDYANRIRRGEEPSWQITADAPTPVPEEEAQP